MENLMWFFWSVDFIILMLVVITISWVFSYNWKVNKDVLTMLWVFGTFLWIVSWLYLLDSSDIPNSVPYLIDWLKTAFITSIAWLFWSIILIYLEKKDDNKWTDDILLDISNQLSDFIWDKNESNKNLLDIKNELLNLNKNIWWEWESSLLTQVQKLRTTFLDKQDELNETIKVWNNNIIDSWNKNHEKFQNSFDEFASKMADQNINALTEAIEKVMWEFNTTINEKLWKVFEDFKESVNNLNLWQAQYKEQIIDSTNILNKANESLEKSSNSFEITSDKAESFVWISESLWNEIKVLNNSLEIFKNWINEFDWIANNSKESGNKIIESIESLKNNFVDKAEIMVSESESHIKNMKNLFEKQTNDITRSHNEILNDLKNNVDNTNKNVSEQFERIWNELEKQVIKLDDELWNALEKSLSSLWTELTSITNKFTQQLWELNNVLSSK